MRPIDQPEELRRYYRDPGVVELYLEKRTAQPLNGVLHQAQVRFLNETLATLAPRRVLEIAPGPARLTAEMEWQGLGVAVDASPTMLTVARRRLRERGREWLIVQADGFTLPFADRSFDVVCTLKFIRHFQLGERQRLYNEIRRVLAPGGAFVLDAQNRAVSQPHRERKGLEGYPIYDVLYTRAELLAELRSVGFRPVRVEGILNHFPVQARLNRLRRVGLAPLARTCIRLLEHFPRAEASTWMVLSELES